MVRKPRQLISYIAPSAPATRRPAEGWEAFLRPEIGFTPKWYHEALGIDFGRRWHTDPAWRRETVLAMRGELRRRFPRSSIGGIDRGDAPLDLLTGTFGGCVVAGIYGVDIVYAEDGWPACAPPYLTAAQADRLRPPDLSRNAFFQDLMAQLDWIAGREGRIEGYLNWQGVLNNAHRLCGQELFVDMKAEPGRARHVFACVASTMIDAALRVCNRQRETGVDVRHFTVSNCLVNTISAEDYREFLLPLDRRLAETFGLIGIHNCAWNVDAYLADYAAVGEVGYIDMGLSSDLSAARAALPRARRAVMYTPMDLRAKRLGQVESDLRRIAAELGPCDVVFADVEAATPDERIRDVIDLCKRITAECAD